MNYKYIPLFLIIGGLIMLFSDFWGFAFFLDYLTTFRIIIFRFFIGLPLCIFGIILALFLTKKSKISIITSIIFFILGLLLLTIDQWLIFPFYDAIKDNLYISSYLGGIFFLSRIIGILIFLNGIPIVYILPEKLSSSNITVNY